MSQPRPARWMVLSVAGSLALACARPEPAPGPWQTESGARWRALGGAGRLTPGFTRMTAAATGIAFSNSVSDSAAYANRHLMHGSGVAVGDVDGDGRADIYLARIEGPNALYLNEGVFKFREAAAERGVALAAHPSTGAVFADLDGDQDLDLIVTAMGGPNTLFLNDGRGLFTDQTARSGFIGEARGSTTAALADVDGDGDLDLYVANYRARTMLDSLSPQERAFDQVVRKVGDGYEVIPERRADYRIQIREDIGGVSLIQRADPDWFYLNEGNGSFVREPIAKNPRFLDEDGNPLADEPEDFGLAARFYDVNGDGAPDLYVANDFEDPDQFWINDGRGRFRLIARHAVRRTANSNMSVDFADIDRDGAVDIFQADMLANDSKRRKTQAATHTAVRKPVGETAERAQWQRNALLLNRGDGTFAEISDAAGVSASGWSWSSMFLDVDLDGFEDLLIANGHTWDLMDMDAQERLKSSVTGVDWRRERQFYPKLQLPNVAFRNRGDRTFSDQSVAWRFGLEDDISHGMAAGDLDGDGDLDVVINRLGAPVSVLRNDAPAPRVTVRLVGRAPNTAGIGAQITVRAATLPVQTREVTAGGLYLSSSDQTHAFAAGTDTALTLDVRWRSGGVSRVTGARAGRLYEIQEPDSAPASVAPDSAPPTPLFEDVSSRLGHRHTETLFNDYARQPLLTEQLSQLGPGVSWLDLDGDGDDDLVIPDGGGGELAWHRNDGARFTRVSLGVPAGDLDFTTAVAIRSGRSATLLVGRSSYQAGTPEAAVRTPRVLGLGLTSGTRAGPVADVVPGDTASVSALALADVEGDGDLDLFVGSGAIPTSYPVPGSSHLYRNDGGRFTLDAGNEAALRLAGLVSAAQFSDVDGDGDPDLVLATDWGPVKLFRNERGSFAEVTTEWGLAPMTGRWNGLAAADLDADGRMDLVVTSWGRNLPVRPDSANPLLLYVGNLGDGQRVDLIAAQHDPRIQAIAPVVGFSHLAWAAPSVRRRIPTFAEYADASIEKVLGPALAKVGRLQVTTYDHTVLLNRGGRFEIRRLPDEAQLAPAFAAVAADFDGDGHEDLFLAQNFSATEISLPRYDAGRGLLLLGEGTGGLVPMPGRRSGLAIYGDQRGAAASDFDKDGRTDLAVSQNGGATRLFRNGGGRPGLRVRLAGPPGNPDGVGAVLRLRYADGDGPAREMAAGSSYWSVNGAVAVLGRRAVPRAVWVKWPGGRETETPVPAGATEIEIRAP